jgi:hypothetical protein
VASDWVPVVAGAVAGAGTGLITSVVAPWTNWGIEKRREKRAARTQLIADWRAMVARHLADSDRIVDDPDYLKLRRHLSPERLRRVEVTHHVVVTDSTRGISADDKLAAVTEQIDELEREWDVP